MDIFATLPRELIALILGNLPDLKSLYNIVKASPSISQFLVSPLGATVLDGLLDSWGSMIIYKPSTVDSEVEKGCPKTRCLGTTPWVPYILRLIALVRHCSAENPAANSLTSFILKFIMPKESMTEDVPELKMIPPHCAPNVRLQNLLGGIRAFSTRELLFLIRRVLVLANECFHFFLERVKATQPQHLAEKPSGLIKPVLWGHRPDGQPWGQPYEIDAGGESSWYETQRIILGFCSLQLRYELCNAVHEGRLDWPVKDAKAIRSMGTANRCTPELEKSNIYLAWEPMWAAAIYVASLKGLLGNSSCVGDTDVELNGSSVFFDTGFKALEEGHLRLPRPKHEDSSLEWPDMSVRQPPAFSFGESFHLHCGIVISGSKGFRWAADILCPPHGRRMTEGLLFRPLRGLGFGIWDDERMARMEMIDDPNAGGDIPRRFRLWGEDQAFTWGSLLSPEDKEGLRTYQEASGSEKEETFGAFPVTE